MLPSAPSPITAQDVRRLIGMREGPILELKREIPRLNDQGKVELLKDVSAMANAIGGSIVYGIEEKDGVASKLVGIQSDNIDDLCVNITNIIATGLSPAAAGIEILHVMVEEISIIIIRTTESHLKPHRVIYGGRSKYYLRHGMSSREMTDADLRMTYTKGTFLGTHIDGVVIKPNDLLSVGQGRLSNRTITNCTFLGPGTLVILGNTLSKNEFRNCQMIVIPGDNSRTPIRSSGIIGCHVTGCFFFDLTLIVPPNVLEAFVADMPSFLEHMPIICDGRRN